MTSITRRYSISLQSEVLCIIVPHVVVALALFGTSFASFTSFASSRADDNGKLNIILVTSPPTHDPTLKKISETLRPTTSTEFPIVTEERTCVFFVSKSHI